MSSVARSKFLDLRALAALEHMRFTTRHRIEGSYSGRHQSRLQGGAGEFVDYRSYVEGEDIRRLDWKVLSRTGRAYIRLYQEETNLSSTVLIDASGSMRYGQRTSAFSRDPKGSPSGGSKLEYAQYLATALSHVVTLQQDQFGLAVVSDGLREFIPPGCMRTHTLAIQEKIEKLSTHPATDLAGGLRDLFERLSRRGVLMLLSDFLVDNVEKVFSVVRLFRHRRWEVVVLHLIHPDEEQLPDGVAYRFEGLENEGQLDCSPEEIRTLYAQRFANHAALVRRLALACGCDYRRVSTAVPYLQTLSAFLVERAG